MKTVARVLLTLVVVGNSTTCRLDTDRPWLYTPRGYSLDPRGTNPPDEVPGGKDAQ